MAFPRKLLNDNEVLVLDLRPHWLAVAVPSLAFAAAIVLGLVVVIVGVEGTAGTILSAAALVLITVVGIWFVARLLGWANTNFVLTSDRIITRRGVLTKSGIEIPLERINTVFFNQRFLERLVGAGDLGLESAGERGSEQFGNVRKPAVVQREIYVQIEQNENRKFDRISTGGTLSPAEQLEKLHDLLGKGAITPAQYEAEKARLLG